MRRQTTAAPITALHSITKTCGLFDIDVTNDADGKFALVTDDLTATPTDFISLCGGDILEKSLEEANIFDLPTPEAGLDAFPFNFGEEFMDLSDFLLMGNDGSAQMAESCMDVSPLTPATTTTTTAPSPAPSTASRKRSASALEDTDDSVFISTKDHCDYTIKLKRPRLSTVSSEVSDSDAESTISSVSSMSAAVTPTERKVQRRIKNNVASRRSRETRKQKFSSMEEEAMDLERKNKELSQKVIELETLAKQMKAILVQRLAKSPALL